jgi:hypothetical protein
MPLNYFLNNSLNKKDFYLAPQSGKFKEKPSANERIICPDHVDASKL